MLDIIAPRRVLVTGATGFVGSVLCQELASTGAHVVAVQRTTAFGIHSQAGEVVEPVFMADIGAETNWRPYLSGVDVVIHLAARVHVEDTGVNALEEFRRVNVEGSRQLAYAAARAGVRRLVYVSSIKVNGARSGASPLREIDVPAPQGPYAISKWEAEQVLHDIARKSGMEIVILRPPLVYGPGVKANFHRLMRLIDRGLPLPFGDIDNRRSLVYVGNLVQAIFSCMDHVDATGRTYLISDGEDVSTPELVYRLGQAMSRSVRMIAVPVPLLRMLGRITGNLGAVESLVESLAVDSTKIRRELGFENRCTLDQGLTETVAWFTRHAHYQ